MNSPKVSVIMPVFNAEKTIRKSLDSIVTQTLTDWELVIVDDGSPDRSGEICDNYARQDSRFKVIHQENAGVSAARQKGLDAAIGEYVIHVDPDDWVEPTMLEELYEQAKADNADMVICDFYKDFPNKTLYSRQAPTSLAPSDILDEMLIEGNIHGSCCNKLVSRSAIKEYTARFPKGINYCEDVCFNLQLLIHPIKISYLNKAYYHYVQLSYSITNKYTKELLNEQKKYVAFLSQYLYEHSALVMRSKELIKKITFRKSILTNDEFDKLYPEIRTAHNKNLIIKLMYTLAFTGHHFSASILKKLYHVVHNH